jgi:UDP-N-acetylglucosamine:LPS N-acetylglucosamine transferase
MKTKNKKILAISTGGGHWSELILMIAGLNMPGEVKYVTTLDGLPQKEGFKNYSIIKDSNKNEKIAAIYSLIQVILITYQFKPNIILTTGAAPGVFAVLVGKLRGSKTIWVDSIANVERLSLSCRMILNIADIVITQWEHLADGKRVIYVGSVF